MPRFLLLGLQLLPLASAGEHSHTGQGKTGLCWLSGGFVANLNGYKLPNARSCFSNLIANEQKQVEKSLKQTKEQQNVLSIPLSTHREEKKKQLAFIRTNIEESIVLFHSGT